MNTKKPTHKLAEVKATYKRGKQVDEIQFTSPDSVYNTLKKVYDDDSLDHVEKCYLLLLNRANKYIGYVSLSSGGVSGTVIDPKVVFQHALLSNASAIILSHNHPSGNLTPSEEDKRLTHKIYLAGQHLEITLLDHIIVTRNGYTSMANDFPNIFN